MDLTQKKCKPCEGDTKPMPTDEAKKLLGEIPSWKIEKGRLLKEFKCRDFKEAIEFVNEIAALAEREGHHPDVAIHWSRVVLEIWTHAIKGLSENDFILAAKIDEIYQKFE